MKSYMLAASAILAACAFTPAAQASVSIACPQISGFGYCTFMEPNTTGGYGNSFATPASFTDTFTLTLSQSYLLSITATNTAALGGPISFSSAQLLDSALNALGTINFGAVANDFTLSAGTYILKFQGTAAGAASYGGTIDVSPVPEPATWGMMFVGMMALGTVMRRRVRTTSTTFA